MKVCNTHLYLIYNQNYAGLLFLINFSTIHDWLVLKCFKTAEVWYKECESQQLQYSNSFYNGIVQRLIVQSTWHGNSILWVQPIATVGKKIVINFDISTSNFYKFKKECIYFCLLSNSVTGSFWNTLYKRIVIYKFDKRLRLIANFQFLKKQPSCYLLFYRVALTFIYYLRIIFYKL
jgi:hypothetical protein